jgi:hypothetical protein
MDDFHAKGMELPDTGQLHPFFFLLWFFRFLLTVSPANR